MSTILFGYTHVDSDIPRCPCGDPGNYLMCELLGEEEQLGHAVALGGGAPNLRFRCWCGRTMLDRFSEDEIAALVRRYGPSLQDGAS